MIKYMLVLFALLCATSVFATISDDDFIAWYSFEDNLDDYYENWDGINKTAGVAYDASGIDGKGIKLNAGTSYVRMPDITDLDSVDEFTACGWLKASAFSSGAIFSKGAHASYYLLLAGISGTSTYTAVSNGANTYGTENTLPSTNTWHLICMVYDGTQGTANNRVLNYYDGAYNAFNSVTGTLPTTTANTDGVFIGRWLGQAVSYPDTVVLDEIFFANRAFTAAEIEELWNDGDGLFPPFSAPAPPASSLFDVTAKDIQTANAITNITVTFTNGTSYTNSTGGRVSINMTKLANFTVSIPLYFPVSYTNYNTSRDLVSNHSQYPYIYLYNVYNETRINKFTANIDGAEYFLDDSGFVYLSINTTKTVNLYQTMNRTLDDFTTGWVADSAFTDDVAYDSGFVTWNELTGSQYTGVEKAYDVVDLSAYENIQFTYLLPYPSSNSGGYLDLLLYNDASCSGNVAYYRINTKAYNTLTTVTVAKSAFTTSGTDWASIDCVMIRDRVTSSTETYTGYKFGNLRAIDTGSATYFNQSVSHNFANSNDLNTSTYEAIMRFDAEQLISNLSVSPANFTINGTTKGEGEPFYVNAGSYSVTFSAVDYPSKTQTYSVSALQDSTQIFTGVSDSIIQVDAIELFSNDPITEFNVTIWNVEYGYNETYVVTTGASNVTIVQNIPFELRISAEDYITDFVSIESTVSVYNYTAILGKTNAIKLNFYDEETLLPLTNISFTVYAVNTVGFGRIENITGGNYSFFVDEIPSGFYGIQYERDEYARRNYFINIPFTNSTFSNVTLYLLKTNSSAGFVAVVTDTNNRPLSNVYGSLLRRYVENGQTVYKVVDMFKPSVALQGAAPFVAVPNNVAYLFRIQRDSGAVLYQGAAANTKGYETLFLIDSTLYLKVQTSGNAFDVYADLNGFSYQLINTTSRTFWASWSDTQSAVSEVCLEIKANNSNLIYEQCSTSPSGILSYTAAASNSTYYVGRLKATPYASATDETTVAIKIINYEAFNKQTSILFGGLGLFILVLTLITSAIALANNPAVAIMVASLSLIAFGPSLLGFVYIGLVMQCSVFVLGAIAAYMVGSKQ